MNYKSNLFVILLIQVRGRLSKMGALMPMNIFLRQEVDRMQKVISIVRTTLVDLKLAIDGTIIMSENLRDALDNIFDARVPGLWRKVTYFMILQLSVSYQFIFLSIFINSAQILFLLIFRSLSNKIEFKICFRIDFQN